MENETSAETAVQEAPNLSVDSSITGTLTANAQGRLSQVSAVIEKLGVRFEDVPEIFKHTVSVLMCFISMLLINFALGWMLGKDAKFFDLIPIRYVIDVGELILLLVFIKHVVKLLMKK